MQKQKLKQIVIVVVLTVVALAGIGNAISRKYVLNQQITSENPRALRAGTSLVGQGLSSNRAQFASLTSDTGETKTSGKSTKLSFETLGNWTYIEGKTPIPDE